MVTLHTNLDEEFHLFTVIVRFRIVIVLYIYVNGLSI